MAHNQVRMHSETKDRSFHHPQVLLRGAAPILDAPPAYDSVVSRQPTAPQTNWPSGAGGSSSLTVPVQNNLHSRYYNSTSTSTYRPTPPPSLSRSFMHLISPPNPAKPSSTPLPTSFSRTTPSNLPYGAFSPMYLTANGRHLNKGFPFLPPVSVEAAHPFLTHDIAESDWTR